MQLRKHLATACWISWACHPLCGQARHTPEQRYQMFQEYLLRRAADVTRNNLADIQNLDAWKQQRPEVRKRVLYTLGLDPSRRKRRSAADHGGTAGDGYRVQNIVFESMPELYVTAICIFRRSGWAVSSRGLC